MYVCDALGPLTVALPSPKLSVLETMLPSGSVDPAVEAVMVTGTISDPVEEVLAGGALTLSAAVGGWLGTVSCTPADILLVSDGLPTAFTKMV